MIDIPDAKDSYSRFCLARLLLWANRGESAEAGGASLVKLRDKRGTARQSPTRGTLAKFISLRRQKQMLVVETPSTFLNSHTIFSHSLGLLGQLLLQCLPFCDQPMLYAILLVRIFCLPKLLRAYILLRRPLKSEHIQMRRLRSEQPLSLKSQAGAVSFDLSCSLYVFYYIPLLLVYYIIVLKILLPG